MCNQCDIRKIIESREKCDRVTTQKEVRIVDRNFETDDIRGRELLVPLNSRVFVLESH